MYIKRTFSTVLVAGSLALGGSVAAHAESSGQQAANAAPAPAPTPTVTGGTITVYFHVIRPTAGPSLVTDAMLAEQINVLNAAFGWSTGWVFTLGGVDYTPSDAWYSVGEGSPAERQMKSALRRGSASALNIYATGTTALGWGTFPSDYGRSPMLDGVVVRDTTLPGGTAAPFNLGDTAVHQVGHWMGLYDTYQGGCSKRNDQVDDTPAQRRPTVGCPTDNDTCGAMGTDAVGNFMDDSDDSCREEFTAGQDARIDQQFSAYRYAK